MLAAGLPGLYVGTFPWNLPHYSGLNVLRTFRFLMIVALVTDFMRYPGERFGKAVLTNSCPR